MQAPVHLSVRPSPEPCSRGATPAPQGKAAASACAYQKEQGPGPGGALRGKVSCRMGKLGHAGRRPLPALHPPLAGASSAGQEADLQESRVLLRVRDDARQMLSSHAASEMPPQRCQGAEGGRLWQMLQAQGTLASRAVKDSRPGSCLQTGRTASSGRRGAIEGQGLQGMHAEWHHADHMRFQQTDVGPSSSEHACSARRGNGNGLGEGSSTRSYGALALSAPMKSYGGAQPVSGAEECIWRTRPAIAHPCKKGLGPASLASLRRRSRVGAVRGQDAEPHSSEDPAAVGQGRPWRWPWKAPPWAQQQDPDAQDSYRGEAQGEQPDGDAPGDIDQWLRQHGVQAEWRSPAHSVPQTPDLHAHSRGSSHAPTKGAQHGSTLEGVQSDEQSYSDLEDSGMAAWERSLYADIKPILGATEFVAGPGQEQGEGRSGAEVSHLAPSPGGNGAARGPEIQVSDLEAEPVPYIPGVSAADPLVLAAKEAVEQSSADVLEPAARETRPGIGGGVQQLVLELMRFALSAGHPPGTLPTSQELRAANRRDLERAVELQGGWKRVSRLFGLSSAAAGRLADELEAEAKDIQERLADGAQESSSSLSYPLAPQTRPAQVVQREQKGEQQRFQRMGWPTPQLQKWKRSTSDPSFARGQPAGGMSRESRRSQSAGADATARARAGPPVPRSATAAASSASALQATKPVGPRQRRAEEQQRQLWERWQREEAQLQQMQQNAQQRRDSRSMPGGTRDGRMVPGRPSEPPVQPRHAGSQRQGPAAHVPRVPLAANRSPSRAREAPGSSGSGDSLQERVKALEAMLLSTRTALQEGRAALDLRQNEIQQVRRETIDELLRVTDALEFRETEMERTKAELRSTRAEVTAMEGKLSAEFRETRSAIEERERQIRDLKMQQSLLRMVKVVWPNEGSTVEVVGSFNGWTTPIVLTKSGAGVFAATLNLYPGNYEIKFVVDGVWKVDPNRPIVYTKRGSENNLLVVKN